MAVTVPGAGNASDTPPLTVAGSSADVLNLAAQIGALLSNIQGTGGSSPNNLSVTSFVGTSTIPGGDPLPTVAGSKTTELIINTGPVQLDQTIPGSWNYVIDNSGQGSTLTGTNVAIIGDTLGGAYSVSGNSTVAAQGGSNTVSAQGHYVLSFAPGDNLINAQGVGTIATDTGQSTVNSAGNDLIVLGGSDLVSLGGAAETVVGGAGTSTITGGGAHDLIFGDFVTTGGSLMLSLSGAQATVSTGDSNANITMSGTNALVFGGTNTMAGSVNLVDMGTNDSVDGINSPMTVTAGAGSSGLLVFGATTGGLDFLGGNSSATVFTGAGTNIVTGGTGGLLLSASGNDAVSGAAPGGATLFGTSSSSVTYTGAGNLLYAAGAGNETLNAAGSTGNNYFVASPIVGANDLIAAGGGSDTVIAGAGSDTFQGGGGADTFAFFSQVTAGSHDFITGLKPEDNVALGGYGSAAKSTATSNGSTTITLSDNTQITFVNVINPANVHFG